MAVQPTHSTSHPSPTKAAPTTTTTGDSTTRGLPYYARLRKDLKSALDRKRDLDRTLSTIENTIARTENAYLEETSAAGNIVKGFDNYIKASVGAGPGGGGGGTATRRKGGIVEVERIFSRSSVGWLNRDSPAPLVVTNSISVPPSEAATPSGVSRLQSAAASGRNTPTSTGHGKASKYKKKGGAAERKKEEEDAEEEERPAKRGKVSWTGRD